MNKPIPYFFALLVSLVMASQNASASPAFCKLSNLQANEVELSSSGIKREHAYKIGSTLLIGLAVGDSKVSAVKQLPPGKACTWYFNDGNKEATQTFNWDYLPFPDNNPDRIVPRYMRALERMLDESSSSIWSCLEEQKAIALGCDGMKHRGPTVFAMLLSFMGCEANESVTIVNSIWGLNGVTKSVRLAAAEAAYEYGRERTDLRNRALRRFTK